ADDNAADRRDDWSRKDDAGGLRDGVHEQGEDKAEQEAHCPEHEAAQDTSRDGAPRWPQCPPDIDRSRLLQGNQGETGSVKASGPQIGDCSLSGLSIRERTRDSPGHSYSLLLRALRRSVRSTSLAAARRRGYALSGQQLQYLPDSSGSSHWSVEERHVSSSLVVYAPAD